MGHMWFRFCCQLIGQMFSLAPRTTFLGLWRWCLPSIIRITIFFAIRYKCHIHLQIRKKWRTTEYINLRQTGPCCQFHFRRLLDISEQRLVLIHWTTVFFSIETTDHTKSGSSRYKLLNCWKMNSRILFVWLLCVSSSYCTKFRKCHARLLKILNPQYEWKKCCLCWDFICFNSEQNDFMPDIFCATIIVSIISLKYSTKNRPMQFWRYRVHKENNNCCFEKLLWR